VRLLLVLFLGGIFIACLVGVWQLRAAEGRDMAAQRTKMTALEEQLADTKQSIVQISARKDRFIEVSAPTPAGAHSSGQGSEAASQGASAVVKPRPTMDQMRDEVENRFASEPFDPSWSRAAESQAIKKN